MHLYSEQMAAQQGLLNVYTVEARNVKNRADVLSRIGIGYPRKSGGFYQDLLHSAPVELAAAAKENAQARKQDQEIIEAVLRSIEDGYVMKDVLIKAVRRVTAEGTTRIREVINARTGSDLSAGHRWSSERGLNNAQIVRPLMVDAWSSTYE